MAAPATYTGQLNSNEIFSAIHNMIISQQVFTDNLGKHQKLVDRARVDGGLYGDTKLYYSTDVLSSSAWGNDSEAANLLTLARPAAPHVQAITLNKFRQISLTVDYYLTKRAWSDEGAFSAFNSVMLGWMRQTKELYEGALYNVYIGTTKSSEQTDVEITTTDGKTIAEGIADLIVKMGDYSRDYNDLSYMRSYDPSDIKLIISASWYNKIKYIDLPALFHNEDIKAVFDKAIIVPDKYFGAIGTTALTTATNTGQAYSAIEQTISNVHYFPGENIASGVAVTANTYYTLNADIIGKVVTELPPFMSAFEAGTSFFNPKSLTENHYLTWGFNTLAYFHDKPFITLVKESE